jgi:hypothetical protein
MFGTFFNRAVDRLPRSVQYLEVGDHFDQPLDRLPGRLTNLVIGFASRYARFNRPLDQLPASLRELLVGWTFDHRLTRLPSTLKAVLVGPNHPINATILEPHIKLVRAVTDAMLEFGVFDQYDSWSKTHPWNRLTIQ